MSNATLGFVVADIVYYDCSDYYCCSFREDLSFTEGVESDD